MSYIGIIREELYRYPLGTVIFDILETLAFEIKNYKPFDRAVIMIFNVSSKGVQKKLYDDTAGLFHLFGGAVLANTENRVTEFGPNHTYHKWINELLTFSLSLYYRTQQLLILFANRALKTPWIESLLSTAFFIACRSHGYSARSKCNMHCFRLRGGDAFCFYCQDTRIIRCNQSL
ncbi:uncharacterized protein LOC119987509 [Tripterygium wilfordii]|uniref:uncharacterized protein LOC119987509 n=1 Tax=Tripterygium wilfordii TaxID=458696 RepID=UPI0018F81AB7|nr:uncharacterized protein LOC119987509 [Tripterygium wilfordii]